MNFMVNKLSACGAAEVTGLDCSQPLTADQLAVLKQTFSDNPILVIRDQTLTASSARSKRRTN
jgi:taurine dioxygenase